MTVSSAGALPIEVREHVLGQEVAISGRIDVHSVPDVRLLLHEVIDTGTGDIHLRLGDAEIGDSTGLGVLVEAFNRARRAGRRRIEVEADDVSALGAGGKRHRLADAAARANHRHHFPVQPEHVRLHRPPARSRPRRAR